MPAVVPVPAGHAQALVKRVSKTWPAPTLDARGRPVDWVPAGQVVEDWGRLQVVFAGIDVTFHRGVPTDVGGWVFNEPFGPASAAVRFPQITELEALPAFLDDWVDVRINRVRPNGTVTVLWSGLFAVETSESTADGFVADCIGVLYQADLLIRPPRFRDAAEDLGVLIADELNTRRLNAGLRFQALDSAATGVLTNTRGSWDKLLTGFVQDLLAVATLPTDVGENDGVGFDTLDDGSGYYMTSSTGNVVPFGLDTTFYGGMGARPLNQPVVDMAVRTQGGYWLAAADGGVFALGAPFYGSTGGFPINEPVVAIAARPQGDGYWLFARDGAVFAFGAAGFIDNAVAAHVDPIVDGDATGTGAGYAVVDDHGRVYAFGDAGYHGNAPDGVVAVGIAFAKTKDGYWIVGADGGVFAMGAAAFHGNLFGVPLAAPIVSIRSTPTGNGYWLAAADGGVFAFGDAVYRGSVPAMDGVANQWTLLVDLPDQPVLRVKDRRTVHWTVWAGTPGVEADLARDLAMSPNAVYGEGIDEDNCHWRNSRYPVFGDLDTAFFLPLAEDPAVEPYLYAADGVVIGPNPAYQASRVRIEHYENMGEGVSKGEGVNSARAELMRDRSPGYYGTLTLEIDPVEGSRFEVRGGQNVLLKGHRGVDRLLHIAQARVDWPSGRVELEVDEKARDLLTLAAIKEGRRETHDVVRRRSPTRRNSRAVEDRIAVFDCEQGAGQFSTGLLPADQWTVVRVPLAEEGSVVRTVITASAAVGFAAGVWDRAVTPLSIAAVMPNGPFDGSQNVSADPWDDWPEESGLIVAWGGPSQAAGFDPYRQTDGADPTGRLIDNGQWYYALATPPWAWVAIWPDGVAASFTGRFYAGVE